MYPELVPHLRCPLNPQVPLQLARGARTTADGDIVTGWLETDDGSHRYRIHDGIVDLVPAAHRMYTPAQITNYLPLTAWAYERTWRPNALSLLTGEAFGYARELPLISRLTQPERGGLLLDIACSNGLYARALRGATTNSETHVVGIDHSWAMVAEARRVARQKNLRISYVCASAQALPFAPASIAGHVMGGSLNEIGDAPTALREARRTALPDGRFVLMNLVRADERGGQLLQQTLGTGGISFWTLDELNGLFAAAGWRRAGQWQYGVVVFSLLLPA